VQFTTHQEMGENPQDFENLHPRDFYRQADRRADEDDKTIVSEAPYRIRQQLRDALAAERYSALDRAKALRALRYITGGLRFNGKTKYRFNVSNEIEGNRKQFLRPERGEVPFFAVWMSRDSLAIAPPDAQIAVINKWIDWYAKKGSDFKYTPAEHLDDWYF
jgi:hypothetical protein